MDKDVISVAYAEDHQLVRRGTIALINELGGIRFDIEAENGRVLITELKKAKTMPDICIIDISMPEMTGFETIIELKKRWPQIKVLVLTISDIEQYIIRMISYGANGYLLKSCSPEEIKKALQAIHNFGMYYSDKVTRAFVRAIHNKEIMLPKLTESEMTVLKYCCSDISYAQMADLMGTTTRSVEGYRDRLCTKLKTKGKVGLAMFAIQFGIVPIQAASSDKGKILTKK